MLLANPSLIHSSVMQKQIYPIPTANLIPCFCGCGQLLLDKGLHGNMRRFILGHHVRLQPKGPGHRNWKGGRIGQRGYIYVYKPDHHFANNHGYIREHHLVWEQRNNAILLPWAIVHHINKNTNDKRIENLQAMMYYQHDRMNKKDISDRICILCYTTIAYHRHWSKGHNCFTCHHCDSRIRDYLRRIKQGKTLSRLVKCYSRQ